MGYAMEAVKRPQSLHVVCRECEGHGPGGGHRDVSRLYTGGNGCTHHGGVVQSADCIAHTGGGVVVQGCCTHTGGHLIDSTGSTGGEFSIDNNRRTEQLDNRNTGGEHTMVGCTHTGYHHQPLVSSTHPGGHPSPPTSSVGPGPLPHGGGCEDNGNGSPLGSCPHPDHCKSLEVESSDSNRVTNNYYCQIDNGTELQHLQDTFDLSDENSNSCVVQIEESETLDNAHIGNESPVGCCNTGSSFALPNTSSQAQDTPSDCETITWTNSLESPTLEVIYDDKATDINSPDSNDSGIQADVQHVKHVRGPVNNDLYAVVDRSAKGSAQRQNGTDQDATDNKDDSDDDEREPPLPPGWEKHEDEDGAYYWHIKSGTIQRDPPPPLPKGCRELAKRSVSSESNSEPGAESTEPQPPAPAPTQEPTPDRTPSDPMTSVATSLTSPTVSVPTTSQLSEAETSTFNQGSRSRSGTPEQESDGEEKRIRFAVRSLGWVRIAEEDLTPERSSKAVNKCIVNLSLGRNDLNDVVGRWGDGKDLFMDLDSEHLTLIDPQDMSYLNIQPIQSIRVWGVGRDNGRERDFAYVARDRTTRKHMCHVFRCDTPARQIANTLRDICKRIMVERSLQHGGATSGAQAGLQKMSISRPTNLPDLNKDHIGQKLTFQTLYKNTSFPTPMEEPKKVLRCHYLGSMQVTAPSGVEVINSAMEKAYSRVPPEKWVFVSVGVAPSTITIIEHGTENVLAECRVRFLSFMGIAMRNVKMCAFIMHTAQDSYMCHIFHSEPSAGALCKTIEAACKLRYQKCLDAHPQSPNDGKKNLQTQQKQGLGASLKSVFGSMKSRKNREKEKA